MITAENIVKIRTRVEYMFKEITVILESTGDIQTKEFYRHVKFLELLNNITSVVSIQNKVDTLIDACMRKPETKIKYLNLLSTVNEFLNDAEFNKS